MPYCVRSCVVCFREFTPIAPKHRSCSSECSIELKRRKRAAYDARNPDRHKGKVYAKKPRPLSPIITRSCPVCQAVFTSRTNKRFCSKECGIRHPCRNRSCSGCGVSLGFHSLKSLCDDCRVQRTKERDAVDRALRKHRGRAEKYGVEYEHVDVRRVYARDGWKCGICGDRVDRRLKYPHRMSASLDHVMPLSLGGSHTYVNTQCAHWICNVRKGNRLAGDQLALIG